jgi:protein-tyrosine phosphatase
VPPFTVLQVCMGNICRSPMAERLLVAAARELAGARADEVLHVHGAGTGGWHEGEPMDAGAQRQVLARGGSVDGFRARKLRGEHIDASDLILTATAEQVDFVLGLRPDAADRTFVLGEFGRLLAASASAASASAASASAAPQNAGPRNDGLRNDGPRNDGPQEALVYERGVALVAGISAARGGRPPEPGDDLDDPWGRGDAVFARVADEVEATVRPLAAALLS